MKVSTAANEKEKGQRDKRKATFVDNQASANVVAARQLRGAELESLKSMAAEDLAEAQLEAGDLSPEQVSLAIAAAQSRYRACRDENTRPFFP